MIELVCASANPDKVAEMAEVLSGHGRAAAPARRPGRGSRARRRPAGQRHAQSGCGVRVRGRGRARRRHRAGGGRARRGEPGRAVGPVRGPPTPATPKNVARLLAELRDVAPSQRTARFRTVAVVQYPDGTGLTAEGVVEGMITTEPRGDGRLRLRLGVRPRRRATAEPSPRWARPPSTPSATVAEHCELCWSCSRPSRLRRCSPTSAAGGGAGLLAEGAPVDQDVLAGHEVGAAAGEVEQSSRSCPPVPGSA